MNTKTIGAMLCAVSMAAFADVSSTDQGQEIANNAAAKSEDLAVPAGKFIPAEKAVIDNLKKLGLTTRYYPEKKSIITQGTAYYECKDPSKDKDFLKIRQMKAMEAYLAAKAEVIRSILTEFSAMDSASLFDDEGDGSANEQFKAKKLAFEAKRSEFVAKFKAEFKDEAPNEVAAIEAAPIDDSFANVLSSLSVWMEHWSVKTNAPNKEAIEKVLANLKADIGSLKSEYSALQEESKKIAATPSAELNSTATMMSKMPLLGASVLTQSESWDAGKGEYSISLALVWSRALQERAKSILVGDFTPAEKKGKLSLEEWIEKQDLSCMVGPRRITDKDGNNLFIGIAAGDYDVKGAKKRSAQTKVDRTGFSTVAFSLVGDVMAYTETSRNLKEYAGDEGTDAKYKVSEKLVDTISQKIEKLNISGITRAKGETCQHPLSGRETYVAVYYLDPNLAKDSMEIIKKMYADAVQIRKASQYKAGFHAGAEKTLDDTRKSKEEFDRGMKEGADSVQAEVRKDETRRNPKKAAVVGAQGSAKKNAKAKGGTVTGDNDIDTDF